MYTRTVLVLLALLVHTLAGPISYQLAGDSTSCARKCKETTKFNYVPGMTYEFEYKVQTQTSMEGASGDRAALAISATPEIEVLSKCDMALRFRNVRVHQSDPSSSSPLKDVDVSGEFRRSLERYPLRFSFQDGVVEELCPDDGETRWALNIKRGLLATIQNSMDNLDKDQNVRETDVTGECNADYKVTSRGWYSTTIKKTKDLLGCTNRHGYQSSIYATQYYVPSDIQAMPLLKSTHENEQVLDKRGLLKTALIKETHTFRPFSQANSGATTKILQSLKYKTVRTGITTRQDYIRNRAAVTFEHASGQNDNGERMQRAENKLREICRDTQMDIRPDTPRLFADLVFIVKNMDSSDLLNIYNQLKQRTFCPDNSERTKKFFLDALPMAATDASIRVMKELLLKNEVPENLAKMWITSLSFIQEPTLEMLKEVKDIMDDSRYTKSTMLPITTMINNMCRKRECSRHQIITNIIESIEKMIGSSCYVTDKNADDVMLSLRALGNAGHVSTMTATLSRCIRSQSIPMEVRVAAVHAYRRLPCTADRRNLLRVYQDAGEDSEMRITAYLAIMQCPSSDIITIVQRVLETERSNQVGAFVWSHLTNLMESSSPQKQAIRSILENTNLKREFDLETLKYSRNYEGSLFLEKFNTGAMLESNVIFSEKSFIPRSAMMNMTVDLFGSSLNLLEVGGRIEGLEYLIEKYLGPYSYFGASTARKSKSNINLDHLRADLYMRMFGNELYYGRMKGFDQFESKKKFNILEFLISLSKNHDYSFTQSMTILESSMIIPTSSGLPLNLTVDGTATIDLKASGQVDLRKMMTSPRSLLIDGEIKPSGSVRIVGTMSMDAFVSKAGLRVVNTWHSSTGLQGRVELSRGKILSAEIDFPQKKMEILDVTTAFFSIHGDLEREQDLLTDNRKTLQLCTGSRLATITGLELCNEFQWSNASMKDDAPYFPFTGPFSQSIILYKRDTHTGYRLMAKQSVSGNSIDAQLALNTPGSQTDRSLSIDFMLNKKQKKVEANLRSPWKDATVKGAYSFDSKKIGVRGSLIVDKSSEYGLISEVDIQKKRSVTTYTPLIEITRPDIKTIRLSGQVVKEKQRANVDLTLVGVTPTDISFKTSLVNTDKKRSISTSFSLEPSRDYTMEASILYIKKRSVTTLVPTLKLSTPTAKLLSLIGTGDYKGTKSLKGSVTLDVYKLLAKPITLKCDIKQVGGKSSSKYTGTVSVTSRFFVGKINGKVQKKRSTVSTSITFDYNFPKIASIKKDRVLFNSKYTDRSTKSLWNYQLNAVLEGKRYPELNFFTDVGFTHNKKHTEADVIFTYGPKSMSSTQHIKARALVNHDSADKAKVNVVYEMSTDIGPLDVSWKLNGKHFHDPNGVNSTLSFNYGKGKDVDASLMLRDTSKKSLGLNGEANLSYPGKSFSVSTDLQQSRKDITHIINFRADKERSSMTTTYRKQRDSIHTVTSDIQIHSFKPIRVTAETNLDSTNFKVSTQAKYDVDVYAVGTTYKYSKHPNAKWSLDVQYPTRHITVQAEGGKRGNTYDGSFDTKWDADNDSSRKISLDGKVNLKGRGGFSSTLSLKYPTNKIEFNMKHASGKQYNTRADFSWAPEKKIMMDVTLKHEMTPSSRLIDGNLKVKSPFDGYETILAQVTSNNNAKKYTSTTLFSWGGKRNQVTSEFNMKKPLTLNDIEVKLSGSSPFKGYKRMNIEVDHTLGQEMTTTVKGNIDAKSAKLTLTGENMSTNDKRNIRGRMGFKSNFKGMKTINFKISHEDNNRKFLTDVGLEIGDDKYIYDLDMTHALSGWQLDNSGKLTIACPKFALVNNWQHRNRANELKTKLTSEWGKGKRVFFNIFGNHASVRTTTISGGMTLETPWKPLSKIDISVDHEHRRGLVRHSSSIKQGTQIIGSTDVNYARAYGQATSDFTFTTPQTNIKGVVNAHYEAYPYTGHAEVEWSPYSKVAIDGSLSIPSTDDIDTSLRFTSPYTNFRDITMKLSHKKEASDLVSRASLNYDIRKSLELESRFNAIHLNKFMASVKTPFDNYRSLETGLEFSGGIQKFDARSNFGVFPILGRFSGRMNWNTESDLSAKLRLDTPYEDFQYLQLSATSEDRDQGRHSRIEAEYHPQKTISLDATYTLDTPIVIDVTFRSPFENMEHMSASLKHALRRNSLQTHADFEYGSTKTIGGDLKLKWSKGIDGTLLINTPFVGYEASRVSLRHKGILTEFTTHGEIVFAKQNGEIDLDFQHGPKTTGSFILKTPFSGVERTKATFMKRGTLDNLRANFQLDYGNKQNIDVNINNRLNRRRLDTTVVIKSPFSSDIQFVIDHDGTFQAFTTKVTGTVGSRHSFTSETSLNLQYPTIDVSTNLIYTVNWNRRNMGLKLHKTGNWNDVTVKLTGTLDNDHVDISGVYKLKDSIEGSLTVETPIQGYSNLGLSFRASGSSRSFSSQGSIRYMDDMNLEGTISLRQSGLRFVDTTAELKTPYSGYESTQVQYRHSIQELGTTSNLIVIYGENQKLTSDVSLQTAPFKVDVTVKTPFHNLETSKVLITLDGPWDRWNSHVEVNLVRNEVSGDASFAHGTRTQGSLSISTNIDGLEEIKASLSKDGPWNNLRAASMVSMGRSKVKADINWMLIGGIKGSFILKTPFDNFRETAITVEHSGNSNDFTSAITTRYMDNRSVQGKLKVTRQGYHQITATGELKTPFQNFEVTTVQYSHTARNNYLKTNFETSYDFGKRFSADVTADFTRDINLNALLKTPFTNARTNKLIFTSTGPKSNFQSHAELQFVDYDFLADADFSTKGPVTGSIDVTTNIPGFENMKGNLRFEGQLRNLKATALCSLKDATVEIQATTDLISGTEASMMIKTPFQGYRNIGGSLRHSGPLTRFNTEGSLRYSDERSVDGKIQFLSEGCKRVEVTVDLKTPFMGYKNQVLDYQHSFENQRLRSKLEITYASKQKILFTLNGKTSPIIEINAFLETPFQGLESSKFVVTHEGPVGSCKSHMELQMLQKTLALDYDFTQGIARRGIVKVQTNLEGCEDVRLSYSNEGTLDNLKITGLFGVNNEFTDLSITNILSTRRLFSEVVLKNPYTKDLKMQLDFSGRLLNFKNKMSASMGTDAGLTSETTFRIRNSNIDAGSSLTFSFEGTQQSGNINLHKEGELNNMRITLNGDVNGEKAKLNAQFRRTTDIHAEVEVVTPWKSYKNLVFSLDHSGTPSQFNTDVLVRYMARKEITATLKHSNDGLQRIESIIEVTSPFKGYELSKAELHHRSTDNTINCNAGLVFAQKQLSAELHGSSSPKFEIDVKIDTPFNDYNEISGAVSFESATDRYMLDSKLHAGSGNDFTFVTNIDMSSTPLKAIARLSTPFEDFDNSEISVTHTGTLRDFHSTASIQLPQTGKMSGETSLRYTSPFQMDGMVSLSNDMKLTVQNTKRDSKYQSHIVAAWSPRDEMTLDGSYQLTDEWGEKHLITDMAFTSPFEVAKQAGLKFSHHQSADKYTETIEVEHNGDSVLDMDVELSRGSKDHGTITLRKPRPMQLTLSGEIADKKIDGEMFFNWDRNEPRSNIRVQTTLSDRSQDQHINKDLTVKVIHPSRTLGLVGNILHSGLQTKSRGEFSWNDNANQKVFYEFDVTDRSRRYSTIYDGVFKVGSPYRNLQMDGSYSKSGSTKSLDGSFSWDADRDNGKKVGVKAVLTPGDRNNKADVSLSLPSIGKDLKIDTEVMMMVNDGRTLFNGRTELSYSSDSRKTITVTSRLDDISYGHGNKNYSFQFGINHPYTDIDINLSSHVGTSEDKFTSGIDMKYLSARRERKNFALRGEINKLRKMIELHLRSPMKNMDISGEIDKNPYRLKIRNMYGDNPIQADLTVDTQKRLVNFQTNYDIDNLGKMLHINAKYVNSSAIQADMYHGMDSRFVPDSLFTMRLNTSRILHTRLHWRPQMIKDIQSFLTSKVERYGQHTKSSLHRVYDAIGMELAGKYQRIANALSEETEPYVKLMETEMASVEKQLESIRRDLRRMYKRNDFYLADMDEYFQQAFEAYKTFITSTKELFSTIKDDISQLLEQMKTYPIRGEYQNLLAGQLVMVKDGVDRLVSRSVDVISRIDDKLQHLRQTLRDRYDQLKNKMTDYMHDIRSHPSLTSLRSRMSDNYKHYTELLATKVKELDVPSLYKRVSTPTHEMLAQFLPEDDLKHIQSLTNDVYQEGVWAYKYWQVEKNVKDQLETVFEMLKEVVEEEIQYYTEHIAFLEKTRMTVWDPEHGEVQAEVYMPLPMKSLDTLPNVTPYINRATTAISNYIPDRSTVNKYYENYFPTSLWNSENDTSEIDNQLKPYLKNARQRRGRRQYQALRH